MAKNFWKQCGVVAVGIVIGAIPALITDAILERIGVIPHGTLYGVSPLTIVGILVYRCIYTTIGCYAIARLSKSLGLKLVHIAGVVGVLACIAGVVANYRLSLGPNWYPWFLLVTAYPSAYLGGYLYTHAKK